MTPMALETRSYLRTVMVYLGALVILVGGSFLSFAGVFYAFDGEQEQREPTRLEINAQAAREIRQALATPIPQPSPLAPITAPLARPTASNNAAIIPHERSKDSTKGFDALAMRYSAEHSSGSKGSRGTYLSYDRHAPQ